MTDTLRIISNEYFAGLIDGEGYIGCLLNNNRKQFQPRLAVKMTTPIPLYKLSDRYGGNVVLEKRANPKWKDCYHWWICNKKQIYDCLESIYPFLLVKHEQAYLIMEFISLGKDLKSSAHVPINIRIRRQEIYDKVKTLNRRGKIEFDDRPKKEK